MNLSRRNKTVHEIQKDTSTQLYLLIESQKVLCLCICYPSQREPSNTSLAQLSSVRVGKTAASTSQLFPSLLLCNKNKFSLYSPWCLRSSLDCSPQCNQDGKTRLNKQRHLHQNGDSKQCLMVLLRSRKYLSQIFPSWLRG